MSEPHTALPASRAIGTGRPATVEDVLALAESTLGATIALTPLALTALGRLCDGYARRPFGRLGRTLVRVNLVEAVLKNATLRAERERNAELATASIEAPLFIVAPPRTASTFLHRLVAQHPAFTAPRPWETAYARPASRRDTRRARLAGALASIRRASPTLLALHPVEIDEPEECFALLETSLVSPSFVYHGAPDGYEDWLAALGDDAWDEVYGVYADQLRVLGRGREGRRWVLKSSAHLFGLGALLRAFPDAKIVELHRDGAARLASFRRLLEAHHALYTQSIDSGSIAAIAAAHLERSLARAGEARRAAPDRFLDVDFDDLVAAPAEVVARVLAWAGAPAREDTSS